MAIGDAEANSTAHLAGSQAFRIVQLQYSMAEAAWLGDVLAPAGTDPTIALAREVSQRWRKLLLLELDVPALAVVRGPVELL